MKIQIIIITALLSTSLFSSFDVEPIEAGSRQCGSAATAISYDNSMLYFNPAHLGLTDQKNLAFTSLSYMTGLENGSILQLIGSATIPISNIGTVGAGIFGNFITMQEGEYDFAAFSEMQVALSYGRNVYKKFSAGTTILLRKWFASSDIIATTPFTADIYIGLSLKLNDKFQLGLTTGNLFGMNISASSGAEKNVPRFIRVGAGFQHSRFIIQGDMEMLFETSTLNIHAGGRLYFIEKKIWASGGIELLDNFLNVKPSIGGGGNFGVFDIQYSFSYPIIIGGAGDHVLTLSLKL